MTSAFFATRRVTPAGDRFANHAFRCCALVAALVPALAASAGAEPAGVVTALQGEATVARAADVQPLRFRDDVFLKDRIDTAERSVVRVLLGGKALITVRELSSLTVTETPGQAIVDLREGAVGLEVARKLLKPGESVEIRTPNAIAAVRGSFVLVEVTLPAGVPRSRVIAREVTLPVAVSWAGGSEALESDHTMLVSGAGAAVRITPPRPLTPSEVARAEQVRAGREPKHSEELPEGLKAGLAEEAEQAEKELEELSLLAFGDAGGTSTSELGVNELAATRSRSGIGSDSSGLGPPPAPRSGSSAPGQATAPVGPSPTGGRGSPSPPPPPPPPRPHGDGPGFSELAGGGGGRSNASSTGLSPPARGRNGGPPPGLGKK
ncbi:MAG: FecR domain-containing protein [Candidatus Binatia bacterium]